MAVHSRGTITELLAPNLHKVYVDTGKERPYEYTLLFNVADMPWNPITDQQVSGLSTMLTKAEGDPFSTDEIIIGGTKAYTASAYGLAVEVTWEAWRDELNSPYGSVTGKMRETPKAHGAYDATIQ